MEKRNSARLTRFSKSHGLIAPEMKVSKHPGTSQVMLSSAMSDTRIQIFQTLSKVKLCSASLSLLLYLSSWLQGSPLQPAQYEYQINGNQVSVNWTESASQLIMSVRANSATDQYGLPADPADKAACLASILGMGIATASFIIATGGSGLALAGAGISYLTSAAGTVLGCQV